MTPPASSQATGVSAAPSWRRPCASCVSGIRMRSAPATCNSRRRSWRCEPGRRLRTMRPWPALCLLVGAGAAQTAPQLQPVDGSLAPAQDEAPRQLLADAVQRLPAAWPDALATQRIEVEWHNDLPAPVHGRAQASRMLLAHALLDGWMARPRDAGVDD